MSVIFPLLLEILKRMVPDKIFTRHGNDFHAGMKARGKISNAQNNLKRWNESGMTLEKLVRRKK